VALSIIGKAGCMLIWNEWVFWSDT